MAVPDFSELLQGFALIFPKNGTEHSIQKAREVIAKVMAFERTSSKRVYSLRNGSLNFRHLSQRHRFEQKVGLEVSRAVPFILPSQTIEVIIASIHRYSGETITNANGNDLIINWVSNFIVTNSSGNPKAIQ
jgi:hypothetical protein